MRKLFDLLSAKNRVSKKKNFMGLPTSATSLAEEGVVYSSPPPPCLGGMHTAGAGGGFKFLGIAVALDVAIARSSVSSFAIDFA